MSTYLRRIDFSRTVSSLRLFSVVLVSPAVGHFSLSFHFNLRATPDPRKREPGQGAWFFALTASDAPLIRSRRVVLSTNLLAPHQAVTEVPPGVLRCTGKGDPGSKCLGLGLCVLEYEEPLL